MRAPQAATRLATFIEEKTVFESPIFKPGEPIFWSPVTYLSAIRSGGDCEPTRAKCFCFIEMKELIADAILNPARQAPIQKRNLRAACMRRGGMALMTWPKVESLMLPSTELGPKNCA